VRERATAPNVAKSSSPIANSIACRHPAMTSVLVPESSSEATSHVSKNESSAYDRFHRIDELGTVSNLPIAAQPLPDGSEAITKTMERLSIQLPLAVTERFAVRKPLEELSREHCDQQATVDLGKALDQAG